MSQAVILAGGLGTRLRSALPDLPKPMAPIQGRPFLEYMLTQLKGFGVRDIVFCVGYKAEIVEKHFGDGASLGLNITYSYEKDLLGTGGAVKLAQDKITADNFLLLNGDCYCDYDGAALLEFHRQKNAEVTILGVEVDDRTRFGSLRIGEGDVVEAFEEKGAALGRGTINAGVYALKKELLETIPAGEVYSLERQVFPPLCGNGLYAYRTSGEFIDIGLPEEWQRAQEFLPSKIKL